MWVPHKEYIKKKKKLKSKLKESYQTDGRIEDEDKEKILFYFSLLDSISDLRKPDRQNSSG